MASDDFNPQYGDKDRDTDMGDEPSVERQEQDDASKAALTTAQETITSLRGELGHLKERVTTLAQAADFAIRLQAKPPLFLNGNMLSLSGNVGDRRATGSTSGVDVQVTGPLNGQASSGVALFSVAPSPL